MCRTKTSSSAGKALTMGAVAIAAVILGSPLMAAPERLPQFDTVKNCESGGAIWGTPRQASESCVKSEQDARATLETSWNDIFPTDRTSCSLLVSTGGPPSYVELLSCVEMAREARAFREQRAKQAPEPSGVVAPSKAPRSKQPRLKQDVRAPLQNAAS